MNCSPAAVARVIAGVAAYIHEEDRLTMLLGPQPRLSQLFLLRAILALAIGAKHANQTLGQYAVQTRNKVIWLDAHIQKTPDHIDNVVCVYCREYKMARQRRLNRDLSGFSVANFTHHNLVRVVAQDRT